MKFLEDMNVLTYKTHWTLFGSDKSKPDRLIFFYWNLFAKTEKKQTNPIEMYVVNRNCNYIEVCA